MCRARKFWAFPALQTTPQSIIYKEYKLDNKTSIFAPAGVNQPYFQAVQCGAKFTTGNALLLHRYACHMQMYLRWKILVSIPDVFRRQIGPWRDALRKENKANYHYKWCKLFVCLVPMRPFLSSNKTVLYHVNGPTTVSIIVFEKGLMDTERNVCDFEIQKCITQWTSYWKRSGLWNVTVLLQFREF